MPGPCQCLQAVLLKPRCKLVAGALMLHGLSTYGFLMQLNGPSCRVVMLTAQWLDMVKQ